MMNTISNLINENNKKDFNVEIEITLDNDVKITGVVNLKESIESYAKEETLNLLKNSTIKNYKITNISENNSVSETEVEEVENVNESNNDDSEELHLEKNEVCKDCKCEDCKCDKTEEEEEAGTEEEEEEIINTKINVLEAKHSLMRSLTRPSMHIVENLEDNQISIAINDTDCVVVEVKGIQK